MQQRNNSDCHEVDETCRLSDVDDDLLHADISTSSFSGNSFLLDVSGESFESGHAREEVLARVPRSAAKELRISHVFSTEDMTELLMMARENPNIDQVELVSCELAGSHFGLLHSSTKLVSCKLQQGVTTEDLVLSCTTNTKLTKLHLQDMIIQSSMVLALKCFCHFPALQSFRLVACHLTEESYQVLSAILEQTDRLQSLGIDLRVWSDADVTSSGLAQVIGACENISELCLNGRIMEQVSTDTMLAFCGAPSSSPRRLQLTYRPTELQKFGDTLNRLTEACENLHSIDISEFGNVSSLSFAEYDKTLSTFLTAVTKSTSIRSLALPQLSKPLSEHLAECLSRSESLHQVASSRIAWTPALSKVLYQRSALKVIHLAAGGESGQEERQHRESTGPTLSTTPSNHQLPQLQDLDRCSLPMSSPPSRMEPVDTTKTQISFNQQKATPWSKNQNIDSLVKLAGTRAASQPPTFRKQSSLHNSEPSGPELAPISS